MVLHKFTDDSDSLPLHKETVGWFTPSHEKYIKHITVSGNVSQMPLNLSTPKQILFDVKVPCIIQANIATHIAEMGRT